MGNDVGFGKWLVDNLLGLGCVAGVGQADASDGLSWRMLLVWIAGNYVVQSVIGGRGGELLESSDNLAVAESCWHRPIIWWWRPMVW